LRHSIAQAIPSEAVVPSERSSAWQITYVLAAVAYPLWHGFAPEGARDPWILWWAVGASYLTAAAVARWRGYTSPWLEIGFSIAVDVHIFTLAAINEMHAFYSMGSVIGGIMLGAVAPNRRILYIAMGLLGVLCVVLAALFPHPNMLAFWAPFIPLAAFFHYRLRTQEEAGRLAERQRSSLERAVAIRTRALERRTHELTETNARLLAEIEERQRLEERLVVSQKLEALGRLAGGVAHDFNNFVTTICGYAEFALERLDPDHPSRPDVEQIGRSAASATELVNQLLAFSRRNAVQKERLDLAAVASEIEPILHAVLPENVRFERRSKGSVWIRANRSQIEQVILNLVVNARDATSAGGSVLLEVAELEATDAELAPFVEGEGRFALLRVSDTGIGMDDQTRSRAFDPFFTTKPVNEGTGLGLSIVHGIVKQSEGHLRVRSEPGRGTTLEIAWPLTDSDRLEETGPAPRGADGSERVLVVEDEHEVRRLVRRALQERGYEVLEAEDAETALKLAAVETEAIDLLVADVVMPHMSGFELAKRICDARPGMRVILISGHIDHPSLRATSLPPGTVFVPKPFAPQKLARKVREVLDLPAT
jgi:signal transduction histidine kinase